MGKEIERKFLVKKDKWTLFNTVISPVIPMIIIRQGYLFSSKEMTVRVRVMNGKGVITIKGKTEGLSRPEFEYEIPAGDAEELLSFFCRDIIYKKRYSVSFNKNKLIVDEFLGENEGLILAEIELTEENQQIDLPEWIGKEVSKDPHYYNSYLVKTPYKHW